MSADPELTLLTDEQREYLRVALVRVMSAESEERWAAGWMRNIEVELWNGAGPWHTLAELLGEWPVCDFTAEWTEPSGWLQYRWMPLDEWKAAHP